MAEKFEGSSAEDIAETKRHDLRWGEDKNQPSWSNHLILPEMPPLLPCEFENCRDPYGRYTKLYGKVLCDLHYFTLWFEEVDAAGGLENWRKRHEQK